MNSIPECDLERKSSLRDIRILVEWCLANPPRRIVPRPEPRTALRAYLDRTFPRPAVSFVRPWVPLSYFGEN